MSEVEEDAIENNICYNDLNDFTHLWRDNCAIVTPNGFETYFCGDIGCSCQMTSIFDHAICTLPQSTIEQTTIQSNACNLLAVTCNIKSMQLAINETCKLTDFGHVVNSAIYIYSNDVQQNNQSDVCFLNGLKKLK